MCLCLSTHLTILLINQRVLKISKYKKDYWDNKFDKNVFQPKDKNATLYQFGSQFQTTSKMQFQTLSNLQNSNCKCKYSSKQPLICKKWKCIWLYFTTLPIFPILTHIFCCKKYRSYSYPYFQFKLLLLHLNLIQTLLQINLQKG